jgi:FtsP/CotA-like multicopper oxidase with cupredoxin domain
MKIGLLSSLVAIILILTGCSPGQESSSETSDTTSDFTAFALMPGTTPITPGVLDVVDTNPDPAIFEASLSVDEQDVTIDGITVHSLIYKDLNNPGIYAGILNGLPIPQIVVNVGDEIIVSLVNDLEPMCAAKACDTSIHWHGLELDNDSDGTGVTQNGLKPGENYTYRFKTFRPGIFWFHPHMKPGPQTFAGTYGVFIVKDPDEATLVADKKIPLESNTHTLVLSDIEFDADGDVGYLDGGQAVAWADLATSCADTGSLCQMVANGDTVLVNGQKPSSDTPMITAKSGAGVRLRIVNPSTNRYYRLQVSGNGADNNLYRVGGEGGFLETVRLEGGMLGAWDTKFNKGEIVVVASGRSDVVIVPTGADGDIITISGTDFVRGGPSGTDNTAGDLLYIEIDNSLVDESFVIAEGNDVLGAGGVEDLKDLVINDFYTDPSLVFVADPGVAGSDDSILRLQRISSGKLSIDGVQGHFEDSGADYSMVPYQGATRYALTGDLLEFTISNYDTGQHHPFHHHGFSFQPVRVIDNGALVDDLTDDTVLYEFDYNEFVDVIDVYGFPEGGPINNQSIVVRMRLDDRSRITDNRQEAGAPAPNQRFGSGGAAGRWVFHCHLFLHATIGMISELVVLDTDRDMDGVTTEFDCDDFDPMITSCNAPPVADAGPDQALECADPIGTYGLLDGNGSSDPDMDILSYLWTAPGISFDDASSATPNGLFPKGDTTVTLTVSDGEFEDSDDVVISVVDTTPPEISVVLDPDHLWPPNHKMVTINGDVTVSDSCDVNPNWRLEYVTSNEPDNDSGDGNTANDIQNADIGTADTQFDLRAERSGNDDGRTYTAGYTVQDADMNEASTSATVEVAHDQGP